MKYYLAICSTCSPIIVGYHEKADVRDAFIEEHEREKGHRAVDLDATEDSPGKGWTRIPPSPTPRQKQPV